MDEIRNFCSNGSILLTKHAAYRLEERGIKFLNVKSGIMNGELIEDYPTDHPNPSVLILGHTENNIPIHIVVGIGNLDIQIITAYFPSHTKWENDLKNRKEVN
ncbi:MAG: DUF4258 domain-containing protein [Defluviitaleaceae bacterium]|nr:DUF4258 domain-containing protein [Defluviitaleaceae bacterium]